MMLDSSLVNYRGSAYPSAYPTSAMEKAPSLSSDVSTADSRGGAIPLDYFRSVDYGSEYADSNYMMQQAAERAQMTAISNYMRAAYGNQAYGQQPTNGAQPGFAGAPARTADGSQADYGRSGNDPRAPFVPQPGAQNAIMIPQLMPTPIPVPFQVPPGYMLVPVEQNEWSNPVAKPAHESHYGSHNGSRSRPKTQRKTSEKVSKIFVGGLSPLTTVDNLRAHFGKYGEIVDAAVILEPATRKSRGFGYVEFADGIPEGLLDIEHFVDSRRCGVRAYEYNPQDKA
jgi:hypothetical protein